MNSNRLMQVEIQFWNRNSLQPYNDRQKHDNTNFNLQVLISFFIYWFFLQILLTKLFLCNETKEENKRETLRILQN